MDALFFFQKLGDFFPRLARRGQSHSKKPFAKRWERRNNLDPNDASGDNGSDGDPDGDGVSNLVEFDAGVNPRLHNNPTYATDSDGDGLSDWAEQSLYGTDPRVANDWQADVSSGAVSSSESGLGAGVRPVLRGIEEAINEYIDEGGLGSEGENSGGENDEGGSGGEGGGDSESVPRMVKVPCEEEIEELLEEEEQKKGGEEKKSCEPDCPEPPENQWGSNPDDCEPHCIEDYQPASWEYSIVWRKYDFRLPSIPDLPDVPILPEDPCWKWILLDAGLTILDLASIGSMIGDWLATPIIPGDGMALAAGIQGFKASVKKKIRSSARRKSINQINKSIKTGKTPKSIKRADRGKVKGEQDHVHFNDGSAINRDGTFKHGNRNLTNKEKQFLQDNGFSLPK